MPRGRRPAATPSRPLHTQPFLLGVVAAGGALGSAVRYLVARWLPAAGTGWPVATLTVNLVGALLLGLLLEELARHADRGRRQVLRLFAGTGFCGGLTTYSTLAVETDLLARGGHTGTAVAYALVSVTAGLLATAAGVGLALVVRR